MSIPSYPIAWRSGASNTGWTSITLRTENGTKSPACLARNDTNPGDDCSSPHLTTTNRYPAPAVITSWPHKHIRYTRLLVLEFRAQVDVAKLNVTVEEVAILRSWAWMVKVQRLDVDGK